MSSSTSSSSGTPDVSAPPSHEWKVLLILALVFLASEVGMRLFERHLSLDIAHIRDATAIAREIGQPATAHDVLVLGNSSSRAGIEPQILTQQLELYGLRDARIHFFYPDGGNIGSWRWAWRRYFAPPMPQPDLVMVCGSRSHFDDIALDPVSSASYFVSSKDSPSFLQSELHTLEGRLEFLISKASVSFVNRHRVQRRFLDMIMPYNRKVLSEISDHAALKVSADGNARRGESSARLAALLADLHTAGTPAAVVALPAYVPYDVPDSRIAIVRDASAKWIDLRAVPGIEREDFYDGAHVNHDGAVKLTTALAKAIATP